jgi:hypothetical protein
MALQDVVQTKPLTPLMGETYEGLYLLPDAQVNVFMESVYPKNPVHVIDLLNGEIKGVVKSDQEVTYIHVEGPK